MKITIEVKETNWNASTKYRVEQLAKKLQQEIHIQTPEGCEFPVITIDDKTPQQVY